MPIFRIHIRPRGGLANPRVSFDYCREHGVLGMGWPVAEAAANWPEYLERATHSYPGDRLSSVRTLHDNVTVGDLLWTRDADGRYFLARVSSPWEYRDLGQSSHDADILNVVGCDMHDVEPDAVPGKVRACFRASRTLQRIASHRIAPYSNVLWARLSNTPVPQHPNWELADLFELLDDEETEDLVGIFLQQQGWLIVPSSCRKDTMKYEFVLRDAQGRSAVAQVKTGATAIRPAEYGRLAHLAFLFQSEEQYHGHRPDGVVCIERAALLAFVQENEQLLPSSIQTWVTLVQERPV